MPNPSLQGDTGGDEGREHGADGDARMKSPSQAHTPDLSPPTELRPPSPPRQIRRMSTAHSIPLNISDWMDSEPMIPSTSAPASITMSPLYSSASPVTSNKASPKTPGSPKSASLGRTTQVLNPPPSNASEPRRNSLGDLKIPCENQPGADRTKEGSGFGLKKLQSTYHHLLAEVQTFLESAPPSRATSHNVFSLVRPCSRLRSHTSPPATTSSSTPNTFAEHKQIAATLQAITVKYKISWGCAELLIELGGRGTYSIFSSGVWAILEPFSADPVNASGARPSEEPGESCDAFWRRVKATSSATLTNATTPPLTSGPPNASWRASTGRHDLSQRQLVLLQDMLRSGELPPTTSPHSRRM
ncbi:hypothetical protein OG21DRAFT_1485998 [Imleria badia]|nr:hypothetical protein OG21DRAFT_1485998 [Imleria badia]